jgi:hypothetical protein
MNQQKRTPGTGNRNYGTPHPVRKPQKPVYFDRRFMTDEEHVLHREKYVKLGLITPGTHPTAIEKQTYYGPKGEKFTNDVVVVFKTKEESHALRLDLIAKGIIIPKDRRVARTGTA